MQSENTHTKHLKLLVVVCSYVLLLSSCCFGGDYPDTHSRHIYERRLALIDTSDKIVSVSYKESPLVFYPDTNNSTLPIADNIPTTVFINTLRRTYQIQFDLNTSFSYYEPDRCGSEYIARIVRAEPHVISHNCDTLRIVDSTPHDSTFSYRDDYFVYTIKIY